jgi:serine/threonine protein kinase/tetratricopeptide (TPR) repeat protein
MTTPQQIGRYQVERRVGRGGMAVIYLATDPMMKRQVAIKVLPRQLNMDPKFRTRFLREVEVVASLEDPSVVPVHDYGEEDGQPYFVMRYMPGGSLREKLRKGSLSVAATSEIVTSIASGLDAAHRKGIVHRDIKPGNILFDAAEKAFLSDFGIVKVGNDSATFTGSAILGTPSYMSPELARGDGDIDGRSDIYALGVLIFRMWTGVLPFTATTPMGIAMKHITDPIPRLLDYKPDLPPACEALISKSMAKDREDRFQSAKALAEVLAAIARNEIWSVDQVNEGLVFETGPTTDLDVETPAVSVDEIEVPSHDISSDDGPERSENPEALAPAPNNLPAQVSSFIGRQPELKAVATRLADPECRLLTLLGPGGIGKTRLGLESGENQLTAFKNGVFFIPLAPLSAGEFIVPSIAETIGFAFYSDEEPKVQLFNYLRGKQMLLVMDNFEHLIDSAGIASELLAAASGLKILVTARERLNLQEEWILQIHGMEVPQGNLEQAASFPAMQLFIERARKVRADFELTEAERPYAVRICQLLEGIPLGIELAAAWIRFLSCEEIAVEIEQNLDFLTSSLRNVSQRHRSLRAVFEYSWNLLTEIERAIYRRLSIFRGGFTRQAASKIADANIMQLTALVDKSLLRKLPRERYEMLDLLQQYGLEKLADQADDQARIQALHSNYYADFLAEHESTIKSENQKTALDEIAAELENIRLAWTWAMAQEDDAILARSLESLYRFYEIRSRFEEGIEMVGGLTDHMRGRYGGTQQLDLEHLELYCRALSRQGALNYRLGRHEAARVLLEKAIEIGRAIDSPDILGFSLTYRGAAAFLAHEFEDARAYLGESLALERSDEDALGTAIALHHLGLVAREKDEFPEARRLFRESLEVNQKSGNGFGIAISLNNLGMVAWELGEYEEAKTLQEESLNIRKTLNDRWGIANSTEGLGRVAHGLGNTDEAQRMLEQSISMYDEIGDQRRVERTKAYLETLFHEQDLSDNA